MGFKDIEGLAGSIEQLQNVVLSKNPCPTCIECNGLIMSFGEWENSEYGLPGSSGRICEDDCHCALVPVDWIDDLPGIGAQVKLRGDDLSDIRKIVDVGPNEKTLKELMEEWYDLTDEKLPPKIYDMEFDEIEPFMRKAVAKAKAKMKPGRPLKG